MLLAIDTSTRMIGLALYDGDQVISEEIWQSQNHHTVELAPAIEHLLTLDGLKASDINALAVALGPGSFTGLRIGLALVKGMALGLHIPIIGIPTMDGLAAAQPMGDLPLVTVLQAGRGRLAVAWYANQEGNWVKVEEPKVTTAEELTDQIHKPTLICGELSADERRIMGRKWKNIILASPAQSLRRPSYIAELAWKRYLDCQFDDPVSLSPIYLHFAEPIPG